MEIRYIDTEKALDEANALVVGMRRMALDLEAAGFHRYDDRLSLVQLTAGPVTFLLDPFTLPLDEFLRPVLEDPGVEIVMHGSDYDLRLLDRDLSIRPQNLFDTQVAATLLGHQGIGLAALLERYFGVKLSKKYQRADWAQRPIPPEMREYAARDTMHLEELADLLAGELDERGRMAWAAEEFEELRKIRFSEPGTEDPVARVKAARDMEPLEVARLREALAWRDGIARERDRAPFRIAHDGVLVAVARQNPGTVDALSGVQGLNGSLARGEGDALVERFSRINQLPEEELVPYPRPPRGSGRGRPDPVVEERFLRLKEVRNRLAGELGLDRGTLLPNSLLQSLAEAPPDSLEAMADVEGMRRWQVEVAGSQLLDSLRTPASTGG
jgi:ribonuclease D